MNLFLNPSLNELHQLLERAPENVRIHYVVVDRDGEVLIDPQVRNPEVDLHTFPLRIGLTEFSRRVMARGAGSIRLLFNKLITGWRSGRPVVHAERAIDKK